MAEEIKNPNTPPAAPTEPGNQGNQQPNVGANIDFDKLGEAIARGLTQKERSVANGFLKEAGLTEEEAKKAFEAYKSQKTKQAEEEAARQSNLQKENEDLKAQILQGKVDTAISTAASELGIAAANLPYVKKLADLTGATNDKGEVDAKKVKEALEKVLTDIPALKASADDGNNKGFQLGGKGSNTDKADEAEKRLRAAFGLK